MQKCTKIIVHSNHDYYVQFDIHIFCIMLQIELFVDISSIYLYMHILELDFAIGNCKTEL